jgi:hypothetical protein
VWSDSSRRLLQSLVGVGEGRLFELPALCIKRAEDMLAVAEINAEGAAAWRRAAFFFSYSLSEGLNRLAAV